MLLFEKRRFLCFLLIVSHGLYSEDPPQPSVLVIRVRNREVIIFFVPYILYQRVCEWAIVPEMSG